MKLSALTVICLLPLVSAGLALAQTPAPAGSATAAAPAAFSREKLLASIGRQLTERFQLRGELQLELQRPWTAPASATGDIEVVVLEYPARLVPSLLLRVKLQTEAGPLGEQTIPLHAQLLRDVFVARAPLIRESTLDPQQLDQRRVDVLRERDVVAADDFTGEYIFLANIPAGRLLAWRDLTRRTLVRKGQIIEVAAIDGAMTITMKAQAMENGAAGDPIRVRNLVSKKDFTALVVSEARAQVSF